MNATKDRSKDILEESTESNNSERRTVELCTTVETITLTDDEEIDTGRTVEIVTPSDVEDPDRCEEEAGSINQSNDARDDNRYEADMIAVRDNSDNSDEKDHVKETNTVKGTWKMAEVVIAVPGSDSLVRDVTLRYKVYKPGQEYKDQTDMLIKQSVHRLIVLPPVEEQG